MVMSHVWLFVGQEDQKRQGEFYNNNCDTRCNATYMYSDPSITFMIREFLTIKGFRNGR